MQKSSRKYKDKKEKKKQERKLDFKLVRKCFVNATMWSDDYRWSMRRQETILAVREAGQKVMLSKSNLGGTEL